MSSAYDYDFYNDGLGTNIIEECATLPNPIGFIHFPNTEDEDDDAPPSWRERIALFIYRSIAGA